MRKWSMLVAGVIAGAILMVGVYGVAAPAGVLKPARIGVVDFSQLMNF